VTAPTLQLADARRMMDSLSPLERAMLAGEITSETLKDKSYQLLPLGMEAAGYLRWKRKRLTDHSRNAYESTLDKFARHFPHLDVRDFEPPVGTQRLEEWLDAEWGKAKPATYNRHLAVMRDFFKWQVARGSLNGDPTTIIDNAKKREVYRTTFNDDQRRAIIASQPELRDRIALRLLLHYGLRRAGLQAIQFKHFDHQRKRLAVFLKGGKVRNLPLPEPQFWHDLERHIIEAEAAPNHYLMTSRWSNRYGSKDKPEQPMSGNGLHKWWYRCLANAGIVAEGTTRGERMHKARHTAGQALLDATGNLKAVQKLLGHESIQTTADTYVDWDEDALTASLLEALRKEL
jgi:integrase/recombinase XerC